MGVLIVSHMNKIINCYCGKNINKNEQLSSASGGIFPVLAKKVISDGGVVWGASFEGINVVHNFVDNINDLKRLQRSKYVQSDNSKSYNTILEQLKKGREVLYSGTPCQVNGLSMFLKCKKQDISKLILVEVVCHGVPSPTIWHDYISKLSEENGKSVSDITDIQFKYKDNRNYFWNHPGFYVEWGDKSFVDYSNHTWYENGFLGNLYVRPSCHECSFKKYNTHSDLIIGDFWGCDQLMPDKFDKNGTSIVFSLTEKGNQIIQSCSEELVLEKINESVATKFNSRIYCSSKASNKRKKFWYEYKIIQNRASNDEIDRLVENCTRESIFQKYKRTIKQAIKQLLLK